VPIRVKNKKNKKKKRKENVMMRLYEINLFITLLQGYGLNGRFSILRRDKISFSSPKRP
jgi:hypothetical protein